MAPDHGEEQPTPEDENPRAARAFILRVWLERSGRAPPALRGTLADLGGRVLGAFGSIETLGRLIRDSLFGDRR
jgi:hypothetical protein